jgi:hypothetical protein
MAATFLVWINSPGMSWHITWRRLGVMWGECTIAWESVHFSTREREEKVLIKKTRRERTEKEELDLLILLICVSALLLLNLLVHCRLSLLLRRERAPADTHNKVWTGAASGKPFV